MSAALINTFTKPLISSLPLTPAFPSEATSGTPKATERKQSLCSLLLALNSAPSRSGLGDCISTLVRIEEDAGHEVQDGEEKALNNAVTFKLLVNLYAEALDIYLGQAMQVEAEADWWSDVEHSRLNVLMYLVQTLPLRISNLVRTILRALHSQRLPVRLSAFSPSSLRRLFPSPRAFQPGAYIAALFPHLRHQPLSVTSSAVLFANFAVRKPGAFSNTVTMIISNFMHFATSIIMLPIELTTQECKYKRKELERMRNQRAEILGRLAFLRRTLIENIDSQPNDLRSVVESLEQTLSGDEMMPSELRETTPGISGVRSVARVSSFLLACRETHEEQLARHNLKRPSAFVQLWPKLFVLPPLCIYALRYAYASRGSIAQVVEDARETVVGFVQGWLIEPLKDVLRTVRAGGEDIIIRREAVTADLNSLERMALSLAKDELQYNPDQLQELSQKIKVGDLTPILELYEEDIKHPVKSALLGRLLRSVFVQVQKAKVDIDQTLTGIDRLLKSQELTFAFVGVAPAFAIVYLVGGSIVSLYTGGRGRGKYGGKAKRIAVWNIMRRIERLLISQPTRTSSQKIDAKIDSTTAIAPLTSGLLLLAVARLRMYAETRLPAGSRVREGFLEDVTDLEDPDLGRRDKLHVVDRMWRCWSPVLGWNSASTLE
ncbi:hypothetical protein AX15_000027 [Amanita polypyramis BW_CC]|nr:hypothetical protein AX15_000027 [Amanita polypyramis BW_CC]